MDTRLKLGNGMEIINMDDMATCPGLFVVDKPLHKSPTNLKLPRLPTDSHCRCCSPPCLFFTRLSGAGKNKHMNLDLTVLKAVHS